LRLVAREAARMGRSRVIHAADPVATAPLASTWTVPPPDRGDNTVAAPERHLARDSRGHLDPLGVPREVLGALVFSSVMSGGVWPTSSTASRRP
jgi:hypothetical protein